MARIFDIGIAGIEVTPLVDGWNYLLLNGQKKTRLACVLLVSTRRSGQAEEEINAG